jgi:hypothetical protein
MDRDQDEGCTTAVADQVADVFGVIGMIEVVDMDGNDEQYNERVGVCMWKGIQGQKGFKVIDGVERP